ncbi:MAG: MlaD family protein [Bacteroidota bacterium]
MKNEAGFTWKLGMFVVVGLILFIAAIYIVGKQKNFFGSTFKVRTQFANVSGLKVGNNVRFSGINVGTVDDIQLVTDTTVAVLLVIKEDVQPFIKSDATATIGSDGLMGDRVLTINAGSAHAAAIKDNGFIKSLSSVEMEDLMASVKTSLDNAGLITGELASFTHKMNNNNGALSRLMYDEGFSNSLKSTLSNLQTSTNEFAKFASNMNNEGGALAKLNDPEFGEKLDSTMSNLQSGTKGLSDNMEAAKNNFLLRGFFKKKKKAEEKKQNELKKQEEQRRKQQLKLAKERQEKGDTTVPAVPVVPADTTKTLIP